jgi:hypothetical protein
MSDTLSESSENKTNQIDHSLIPDNTFTIILKAAGKVYALGGEIGKVEPDMHDEDLDSTLRALNGAGLTLQRTLAVKVANRPMDYPLPGESTSTEEDLTPKADERLTGILYVAGTEIKKGQALHLDVDGKVYPLDSKPENTEK